VILIVENATLKTTPMDQNQHEKAGGRIAGQTVRRATVIISGGQGTAGTNMPL
jgi:hypothetical protein